jgi:hypothetical protein
VRTRYLTWQCQVIVINVLLLEGVGNRDILGKHLHCYYGIWNTKDITYKLYIDVPTIEEITLLDSLLLHHCSSLLDMAHAKCLTY